MFAPHARHQDRPEIETAGLYILGHVAGRAIQRGSHDSDGKDLSCGSSGKLEPESSGNLIDRNEFSSALTGLQRGRQHAAIAFPWRGGDAFTGDFTVHASTLSGHRVLVAEHEYVIAWQVGRILEDEGAIVFRASRVAQALSVADYRLLSAGVLTTRLGSEDSNTVCQVLNRRNIPFVFHTAHAARPLTQWPGAPIVAKPASAAEIVGALKFVLSADKCDIIPAPQGREGNAKVLNQYILNGEERLQRVRGVITRLAAGGFDTSAAENLFGTMTKSLDHLRYHRSLVASLNGGTSRCA